MDRSALGSRENVEPTEPYRIPYPQTVEDWLVPGRKWTGEIIIPGDPRGNEAARYRFEVIENPSDTSTSTIYALHADDNDRQVVIVSVDEDRLKWHDFETYIVARLDVKTGNIIGRVHQLIEGGDDGFWHVSEADVHSCCLLPESDPTIVHDHLLQKRRIALLLDNMQTRFQDCMCLLPASFPEIAPWQEVFDEACVKSLILQADMRATIMHLQEVTFVTEEEKKEKVAEIQGNGLQNRIRVRTHILTDKCSKELRLQLCFAKLVATLTEEQTRYLDWQFKIVETRSRRVYDQLDLALRQFETRVSDEVLHKYIAKESADSSELCSICFCGASDCAMDWLSLPCKHAFHMQCARQWFHRSCQCPCCRTTLE
eukprot:GEMP01016687.1.p1 GENE.GEMP01016687.1~~GEMP01016687.1.p1  ORF type:complete len:381 (+),score=50.51 GEMP01016687.1:31-1143(+)